MFMSPGNSGQAYPQTLGFDFTPLLQLPGAGVAQSVQCLTTGWTTGRSGFDPRQG
jgi:hypothetical protein